MATARAGVDVIISAHPTDAPFAEDIGLGWQRLERRTVDLLQQLPASHAEPPDGSFFVQMLEQLADGFVDLSQADEDAVTKPPEQPALDNQHRLFDFRLVARFSGARRQDGGVGTGRHFGIGAIDQRIKEAGLYDGGPGIVRHEQMRNAADRRESMHVGVDPIGKRLRPARPGKGEARCAEHCDEQMRLANFARQPINQDWNAIAGVIDRDALKGRMRLAHRRRQFCLEGSIKFAYRRIAVAAWVL